MTASLYGDGASESMTGMVYSPKALTRERTYRALMEYIEKQTG